MAYAESPYDPFERNVAYAEWGETDVAAPIVEVTSPKYDVTVEIVCTAMLGPLETTWVVGPMYLLGGTTTALVLDIPAGAFLDHQAQSFVTDLSVSVDLLDEKGNRSHREAMELAYIAWPDGEDGNPVVWSKANLAVYAPTGTIDVELADAALARMEDKDAPLRILPTFDPALYEMRPKIDAVVRDRVTIPPDDPFTDAPGSSEPLPVLEPLVDAPEEGSCDQASEVIQ